jgi:hypothetical protein
MKRFFALPFYKQLPVWVFLILLGGTLGPFITGRGVNHLYKEGRVLTYLSGTLLLATSVTAWLLYRRRLDPGKSVFEGITTKPFIWALMACGFLFLTADELFEIHEAMDSAIHDLLNMSATPLTDRLDDLLIGLYGVIGLALLFAYRSEMKQFKAIWRWILVGFVLLVFSVLFDMLCNDKTFFQDMMADKALAKELRRWTAAFEDGCKIQAEAFFLAAFLYAKTLAGSSGPDED